MGGDVQEYIALIPSVSSGAVSVSSEASRSLRSCCSHQPNARNTPRRRQVVRGREARADAATLADVRSRIALPQLLLLLLLLLVAFRGDGHEGALLRLGELHRRRGRHLLLQTRSAGTTNGEVRTWMEKS